MRLLVVQVPRGEGERVLELARRYEASVVSMTQALDEHGASVDVTMLHLSNARVGPLLSHLEMIQSFKVSLLPTGVLTLQPPASEAPEQVTDVTPRSPFEIFVAGLQSIGSWQSFLSYAFVAGVVVWLGLYTNTVFLLVAAMLIAPFAGPAMNAAIATARGDLDLLWHSVVRYFSALGVTIVTAGTISFIIDQEAATELMSSVANLSTVAILLPLAAGTAGALQLTQSERSSLVSGAAIGMLVAASLAPPAGLIGMGVAIGEWEMALNGLFLLGLQLAGINLTGALVFRWFGLTPEGPRYSRGRPGVTWISLAVTVMSIAALLGVQFGSSEPTLVRATLEQQLRYITLSVVRAEPQAGAAQLTVEFTRAEIPGQHTVLVVLYIQRHVEDNGVVPDEQFSQELARRIQQEIQAEVEHVTPLVSVTVLRAPERQSRSIERMPGVVSSIAG